MKKTRIELITPIITEGIRTLEEVEPFMRPDLEITQSLIAAQLAKRALQESCCDQGCNIVYFV